LKRKFGKAVSECRRWLWSGFGHGEGSLPPEGCTPN
jgi:hypothetical protein